MPDATTNLLLPYILAAQAQKHVTHNEALRLVPLTAGDTVELQGDFRAQDGYFAADHTSFWGCKVG